MTQDLQQLLEKIQRDGVEKAQTEAARIRGEAQRQAQAALDAAHAEAAAITADARREAEAFERRAEESIRQAARDTLLSVEKAVTALVTRALQKEVNAALGCTELVTGLATEAVRVYLGSQKTVEVAAAAQLVDTLRAKLAAEALNGVTVVTDDTTGTGFRVRLANGRVEHTFTGAAVADALALRLRPQLASLLKQSQAKT